jgi:uncharacterized RDD family membrane protein YckC
MPINPQAGPSKPELDRRPCGLLRRCLIMLYDAMVIVALMMLATAVVLIFRVENLAAGKDPLYTFCLLAVWFVYLAWCWQHGGITLGMRAWRVKLVTDDGGTFGWARSACRFGVSLLSSLLLGAGFIWSLFDRGRRTWHDRLSHSRLVRF